MEIILKYFSFEVNLCIYAASFIITSIALFIGVLSHTLQAPRHHKTTLISLVVFLIITNILIGSYIATVLTKVPVILSSAPSTGGILDMKSPVIKTTFATPVNYKTIRVYSYPETELTITPGGYFHNRLPFGRNLTITPKTNYPAGEPVMIFFSNIEGPFTHGYGGEHLLELVSSELPIVEEIASSEPLTAVNSDSVFTATLSGQLLDSSQWHATLVPPHPIIVNKLTNTTLEIRPVRPFTQGASYTLTLFQTPSIYRFDTGEIIQKLPARTEKIITFTTVNPPFVRAFEPTGASVNPERDFIIEFDEPMDTVSIERSLTVAPDFQKTFVWTNDGKILHLKHDPLAKDTNYVITLPRGITTQKGGILLSDAHFQFKTAGPVTITDSSPSRDATDISIKSPVQITFDQDISGPITKLLTIQPTVSGSVKIAKNIATFTPDKPLAYSTRYTIKVGAGIPSVYGLPSTLIQSVSFSTEPQQIAIAVPYFKQQSAFTCNIASARMLLAFKGVTTDEASLIRIIGSSGTRGNGNPHKGYVSDYGTYWEAVAKGIAAYRPYHLITNGKLSDIVNELVKGNPVMTWGQNGWSDPHDISWTATDSTYIRAINGMHSAVVRGFMGPQEHPTHILLNDPWRGQYTITTAEFLRRWGYFSVALVVD